MARLFLIRHGEPVAAWGGADPDPGLSERGLAQAEAAATALARQGRLAVLSSPMRRARETAAPFAALAGGGAGTEPRVSEVATPAGLGDRRQWLQDFFPWHEGAPKRRWEELDAGVRQWRERAVEAMRVDEDSAFFTHFIAINAIVGAVLGSEHTIVCRPGHASITELAWDGARLRLVALGAENASEVR